MAADRRTSAAALGSGPAVVAVDVGGTTIKATAVGRAGRLGPVVRIPTPTGHDIVTRVVDHIVGVFTELRTHETRALGLALPGIVDETTGIARHSENLGWTDVDFGSILSRRIDRPVAVTHDVRASGRAEFEIGAGTGADTAVVVTIGTGIAAAVRVHGRIIVGGGLAGEIGHVSVQPGGDLCACGGRGCLETVASAAGVVRAYQRRSGRTVAGAEDVLRRAEDGDPDAVAVWDEAISALGSVLAVVSATLAPEAIIIAGGLSESGEALVGPLRADVASRYRLRPTRIVSAALGGDAGVVGAALAARDAARRVEVTDP